MSIETSSSNQPSAAESDIEAFKQAKIRARQEREAAERVKNKEALLESIFADSPAGDTEEDARRFEEGSAYLAHLEKLANRPANFDPLDNEYEREYTAAVVENESFDLYKAEAIHQTKENIAADPKLRRIAMMADTIASLHAQIEALGQKQDLQNEKEYTEARNKLSALVEVKQNDFAELIVDYDTKSSLPADEKLLLTNYLMDRAVIGQAAAPVLTYNDFAGNKPAVLPTTTATEEKMVQIPDDIRKALIDNDEQLSDEAKAALESMSAPDISFTDDALEDKAAIANMEAADVSLADEDSKDTDSVLDMNELQTLASMEAADVSIADSDHAPQTDELSDEDKAALTAMEAADVSTANDDEKASAFIGVEEIKEELDNDSIEKNHQRNRFNPFYRTQLAFNNFRAKNKERGSHSDNERSRASKIAIGATAFGALVLASAVIAKNNPDLVESMQDWMGDLGKNLGFDTNDTPQNDVTTGAEQPSGDTNDALDPTGPSDNANTPETAPFTPELLNAPAFNTPNGGGGELLMNNLGVDTQKWYSISADLPDLFPTEFYREQLPSGLVDIRFSRPGLLSEDAQKVLLQRLGK